MIKWHDHHELEGTHAFLGASKYQWLNYSDDVLIKRYNTSFAQDIGTLMHELASDLIKNRIKLNKSDSHIIDLIMAKHYIPKSAYDNNMLLNVLVPFVKDAIGFRMDSEVILFYDYLCYGTADAIKYSEVKKELRIHDLKTGVTVASFKQLIIYSAMFYTEYRISPFENQTILRLYQNLDLSDDAMAEMREQGIDITEDYLEYIVPPEIIKDVMDRMKTCTNKIRESLGKEPIE